MYVGIERRTSPRITCVHHAVLYAADRRLSCTTIDISTAGILVHPPARAQVGLRLTVEIAFTEGKQPLQIHGTVVRETSVSHRYAWGIQFRGLTADTA